MQPVAPNSSEAKHLIRKAFYLQYALGFIATMLVVSAFNTWIAKHLLGDQVYLFWKFVGGSTSIFGAVLSVKHALAAKYPGDKWGKKVGRFFTFACWLAAVASFLPTYFPATEAAFPQAIHRIDRIISEILSPPPKAPPTPRPPQQVRVPDAYMEQWFDPLHWYVRDRNGGLRFFVGAKKEDTDPVTGAVLAPVTKEVVYEVQRRQDVQEFTNRLAGRQQKARDAQKALDEGNYELALENCPGVDSEFRPDPCENLYHEAVRRKTNALLKRSKQEIHEDKLDEAVRDAQLALRIDPGNEEAKRVLALAQSLERAEGGPN